MPTYSRGKIRKGKREDTQSFTLLEVIVSLAIILAALVGPVSLIVFSLSNVSLTTNKLIAYNLAQEGMELAREIRDNNKLCKLIKTSAGAQSWRGQPDGSGTIGDSSDYMLAINDIRILNETGCNNGSPGRIYTPNITQANSGNTLLYVNPQGVYVNSSAGGATPSIFRRSVHIDFIPDGSGVCDQDIAGSKQADIIATVTWTEKGRAQSIVLKTRIYDWE